MKRIIAGIAAGFMLLAVGGKVQAANVDCEPGSGASELCPVMPDEEEIGWIFGDKGWPFTIANLGLGDTVWIDPDTAYGYEYSLDPGAPAFASVLLPTGYAGEAVTVWLVDAGTGDWYDTGGMLAGGEEYSFGSGVDTFRLLGIDQSLVYPADPTLFVTGLTFVSSIGQDPKTVYQKPITVPGSGTVSEPATFLLLVSGLLGFRLCRERQQY